MIVQHDTSGHGTLTDLFSGDQKVATLPCDLDRQGADVILRILGWRRNEQWQKTSWGYQATLRKR